MLLSLSLLLLRQVVSTTVSTAATATAAAAGGCAGATKRSEVLIASLNVSSGTATLGSLLF